jgi:tape measure domain-containing protein
VSRETLQIEVSEKGARVVKRNIEEIGTSAKAAGSGVDFLKKALGGLGAAYLAHQLLQLSDSFLRIKNQVKVASGGLEDVSGIMGELYDIANRTRSPVEQIASLFQRGSIAAAELGASQKDLLQFVELVGQGLAIQGGSASEASGALMQLSQSLGSGIVRAEEFNSILEGAFPIALAAAKGLDAAGGSVARLRGLVVEGKVTSQEFFKALLSQSDELAATFAQTSPTIGQAFTVLRNNLTKFVGGLADSTGASAVLAGGLLLLADNLGLVAAAAATAGVALLAMYGGKLASAIGTVTSAVRAFTAALAANPIGLVAVAIAGVVSMLVAFEDQIHPVAGSVADLGDYARAAFGVAAEYIGQAAAALSGVLSPALDWAREGLASVGLEFSNWGDLARRAINFVIGAVSFGVRFILNTWGVLPEALPNLFTRAMNASIGVVESAINAIAGAISTVTELTGLGAIDSVSLGRFEESGTEAGDAFLAGAKKAVTDTFSRDFIGEAFGTLQDRAEALHAAGEATAVATAASSKSVAQESKELRKLLDTLDPVAKAEREYAEDLKLLQAARASGLVSQERYNTLLAELKHNYVEAAGALDPLGKAQRDYALSASLLDSALGKGIITQERYNVLLAELNRQTKDALNPLAAVNEQIAREITLAGMSADEREVSVRLREIENQLLDAGVSLSESEKEALRGKLVELQRVNQETERQLKLLEDIRGPQRDYEQNLASLKQLLHEGKITSQEFSAAIRDQRIELLSHSTTAAAGAERAVLKLQKDWEDVASSVEDATASTFNALEDDLVKATTSMEFSFNGLVTSILDGLARIAIRQAILKPLSEALFGSSAQPGGGLAGGSSIMSTLSGLFSGLFGFASGGSFEVSPQTAVAPLTGVDNRLVAFRARDGETVNVSRPGQAGDSGGGGGGGGGRELTEAVSALTAAVERMGNGGVRMVNVVDPSMLGEYVESSTGERTIVNIMRRNKDVLRS